MAKVTADLNVPVMVETSTIIPSPYNPRKISNLQFAGLKASVKKFGLVENLVVNIRNMCVVGGHQRLRAAVELKIEKVPVIYVDLDDLQERMLNITLNNKGIQGEYTEEVLDLIAEIKKQDLEGYDALRMFDVEKEMAALEKELDDAEAGKPDEKTPPDVARLDLELYEHYDYIVIGTKSVHDWNFLVEFFEIQKVRSDRRSGIGIGRAITAEKAIAFIKAKGGKE